MELNRILENYLFGSIKAKVIPGNSWHFQRRCFEILVNVLSRMMFLCVLLMLLGALNPDSTCTHALLGVSIFCSTFYIYKRDVRSGVIGWSIAYDMKSVFFPSSEILPTMRPRRLKSLQRITKEQIYPLFPHSWSWDSHSPLKTKPTWRNILRCYRVPREPILWEL